MADMHTLRRFALSLALAATAAAGCAATLASLPAILAAVQTAGLVISTIQTFASQYFAAHNDPALKAEVDQVIARAQAADAALTALTTATSAVTQAQLDSAVAEYVDAYQDFLQVIKGVPNVTIIHGPVVSVALGGDRYQVPDLATVRALVQLSRHQ